MPDQPSWITTALGVGGMVATVVTAVATIFLWRVTKLLAKETTRMAEASAQPHVVVTLAPNRWSARHFNLHVDNTGNATAYDIRVTITPPLPNGEARGDDAKIPFETISVLKPGAGLSSYLSEYQLLKGKTFEVKISWLKSSSGKTREENSYILRMSDHEGVSWLGTDPAMDVAQHLKKMEKSLADISRKHIQVDVYSAIDRLHEKRLAARERRRWKRSQEEAQSD
ncbi:hypothetical protein ODI84_08060 [Pseudomonas putida]|uniref:hypothetical protein n=1 Tax=Pseudomonas putida TaxID=303 RepID=UPI002D1E5952|nr:hypothetical protein [Pseudomonas putida]MEB3900131.1 hypothetical protein [Pseudomonas putida]